MLAYYSVTAHADFWTEHWGGHRVEALLAVARTSPLTSLITRALPSGGVVLEAGCGLGQYVILLRERGWRAAGVDASLDALAACRRVAAVPVAASDLRELAVRSGALAAYVSLGVVEHDPDGPGAILAEAHRALAAGGLLIASVPYVNGVRCLAAPWIRRRHAAIRARGGAFYQHAFTRREFLSALRRQGFEPLATHPYDPARVLRGATRRIAAALGGGGPRPTPRPAPTASIEEGKGEPCEGSPSMSVRAAPSPDRVVAPRALMARVARRALYTEPLLRAFGHMLLVVARRA